MLLDGRAYCQSTNWDSMLTGSQWFVPTQNLLAYITSTSSLTKNVQVGDQTLWSITNCVNGVFTGLSSQSLTIPISATNSPFMASNTAMNGVINAAGQMQINFTQTNGDVTIALGNYRDVGGTNLIEMQMLSQVATAQNITHWAYMAPYTSANYPTNTPTNPSLLATNWAWMQGTTWNIEDDSLFGTNGSGTFSVSIFNSGYFWGDGSSATNGDFTLIGSATPEGNLILGLLNTQTGVQTSLFGDITGNATNSLMSLSTFTTNGITPGPPAATAALIPGSIANLSVTNGTALYLTNGINSYAYTYVGNAANDSNNVLTVANANTLLTNSQNLYLEMVDRTTRW